MEPEWDAAFTAGWLSWRRTSWDLAGACCALLFAVLVAVTVVSLAGPGYVFGKGELEAECAAIIGVAVLAVLVATRIMAGDRRAEAVLARFGAESWLSPPEPLDGGTVVDFEAETSRLRTLSRRAAVFAVLWCGLFAGFAGILQTGHEAPDSGIRTTAEVVGVVGPHGGSGPPVLRVEYRVDGTARTADIVREDAGGYATGQVVMVVYDPAGPPNVRLAGERTGSRFPAGFFVVSFPVLFAAVASVLAALRWRRRYGTVRRTGWRRATVRVVPDRSMSTNRHLPEIFVRYRDGSEMVLRAAQSTHGAMKLKDPPDRIAWVGGWGRDMVVLFPYGPKGDVPYAVPAYALSLRKTW